MASNMTGIVTEILIWAGDSPSQAVDHSLVIVGTFIFSALGFMIFYAIKYPIKEKDGGQMTRKKTFWEIFGETFIFTFAFGGVLFLAYVLVSILVAVLGVAFIPPYVIVNVFVYSILLTLALILGFSIYRYYSGENMRRKGR
jgi:hypothetical protein